jgi:hypothetical protein
MKGSTVKIEYRAEYMLLVPVNDNEGQPIAEHVRAALDMYILESFGGLTIGAPVQGYWLDDTGNTHMDDMLPYYIAVPTNTPFAALEELANWIGIATRQMAVYMRQPNGTVAIVYTDK